MAKVVIVFMKNVADCFFSPSKYIRSGSPSKTHAITVAESTKRDRAAMGVKKLSGVSGLPTWRIISATIIMYISAYTLFR